MNMTWQEKFDKLMPSDVVTDRDYYNPWKNDIKQFISNIIDQTREETIRLEQERIYAYVEEILIGCDNKLLKDLSNIIFNKSN